VSLDAALHIEHAAKSEHDHVHALVRVAARRAGRHDGPRAERVPLPFWQTESHRCTSPVRPPTATPLPVGGATAIHEVCGAFLAALLLVYSSVPRSAGRFGRRRGYDGARETETLGRSAGTVHCISATGARTVPTRHPRPRPQAAAPSVRRRHFRRRSDRTFSQPSKALQAGARLQHPVAADEKARGIQIANVRTFHGFGKRRASLPFG